jgi:predicted anti-sigma-YlaC factor YlaD
MTEPKCDGILKLLPDYQASLLEGARRQSVEAHLAACSSCRAELEALERTASVLDETKALTPSRDLWPAIAAQLSPRRTGSVWWRVLVPRQPAWRLALVAGIVLFVAFSILVGPLSGPPDSARLVAEVDEEAPIFARWHAEASLGTGMADPYALAVAMSRQEARLEEADSL